MLVGLLTYGQAQATQKITLNSDTLLATAGYYQLTWSWPNAPNDIKYQLEELATTRQHHQSRELYFGPDLARVISGKPNGTYQYIVSAIDVNHHILAQSNAVKIVVAHHSLFRAIAIFLLGAVIFLAILFVILRESAKYR